MLSRFLSFKKKPPQKKLLEKSPKKTVSFSENPPQVLVLKQELISESLDKLPQIVAEPTQTSVQRSTGTLAQQKFIDEVGVSYKPPSWLLSDLSNFSLVLDQESDVPSASTSPLLPPLPDSVLPETFADVLRELVDNPTVPAPMGASYTAPHLPRTVQQTLVSLQPAISIEPSPYLSSVVTSPMNAGEQVLPLPTTGSGGLLHFLPSAPPSPLIPLPLVHQENEQNLFCAFRLGIR